MKVITDSAARHDQAAAHKLEIGLHRARRRGVTDPAVRAGGLTGLKIANSLLPWAKRIEDASNGRIKIEIFPAMSLGGKPPELYRQMVQGIADIVFTLPGYTSGDFPMMSLTELPGTATSAREGTEKIMLQNCPAVMRTHS